jgi:hypothetical protein
MEDAEMNQLRKVLSSPLDDDVALLTGLAFARSSGDVEAFNVLMSEVMYGPRPAADAGPVERWRFRRWIRRQNRNGEMLRALGLIGDQARVIGAFAKESDVDTRALGIFMQYLADEAKARHAD